MDSWEEKVKIVQKHFESKGYSVHSGLQFGGELVLYADDPENVHSDFCIHVVRDGELWFRVSDTSISTVSLI
jgi:tRNA splicing endonuclease